MNRDGSPSVLSIPLYRRLLGANAGPREVVELAAYLWAGLTEYWRATGTTPAYSASPTLQASHPDAYTGDYFADVESLTLQPGFEAALSNAFSPVGVYLDFWQSKLAAGTSHVMAVSLVNDEYEAAAGKVAVAVVSGDRVLVRREVDVEVAPLGQQTCLVDVPVPSEKGPCEVRATLLRKGSTAEVVSRRKTTIE